MYIVTHCGLEYASSVFRILEIPITDKEFNKKQSQIDALEQELNSYEMSLYDLTSGIQEAIDQLDVVQLSKIYAIYFYEWPNKKIIPDFYIRDFLLTIKLVNVLLCILKQFYKILLVSHA